MSTHMSEQSIQHQMSSMGPHEILQEFNTSVEYVQVQRHINQSCYKWNSQIHQYILNKQQSSFSPETVNTLVYDTEQKTLVNCVLLRQLLIDEQKQVSLAN